MDQLNIAEMARSRREIRRRRLQVAAALEGLGACALKEWQDRIAQKLPLNLSPETIAFLTKAAAQLQEQALGPEKDRGALTQINVVLGDFEYPDERDSTEPATIEGDEKDDGKLVN
jgi:hypothetical protein